MNKDVKIIAFTGTAQSGKTTAAGFLYDHIVNHIDSVADLKDGYAFGMEAFAGPIKSMVAMLLDFYCVGEIMQPTTLQPYIDGELKEEVIDGLGASPRKLMQTLGTEWGRETIGEDIWVNSMLKRLQRYDVIKEHGYKGAVIVIDDLRFDNEAVALRELGATIVRIHRDHEEIEGSDHESEAGVSPDLVDIVVANDGPMEDYRKAVHTALRHLLPAIQTDDGPPQYELPWDEEAANDETWVDEEEAEDDDESRPVSRF